MAKEDIIRILNKFYPLLMYSHIEIDERNKKVYSTGVRAFVLCTNFDFRKRNWR